MQVVSDSSGRLAFARTFCVWGAPLLLISAHAVRGFPEFGWSRLPYWSVLAALAGLSMLWTAWQLGASRVGSRVAALCAAGGWLAATLPALLYRPGTAFLLLLGATGWVGWISAVPSGVALVPIAARARARSAGALVAASLCWALAVTTAPLQTRWPLFCATGLLAGASALSLPVLLKSALRLSVRSFAAWATWVAGLVGFGLGIERLELGAGCLGLSALGPVLLVSPIRRQAPRAPRGTWTMLLDNPARFLVVSFALLVLAGTVVLLLPASVRDGQSLTFVDALFTSTSAVCVTGLIVVDTPSVFAGFGQGTLLALIQLGGLGIMTFSTAALSLFHRRPSLRHESALADLVGVHGHRDVYSAVRRMLVVTLLSELLGAALLAWLFLERGDDVRHAVWRGVFTAVSAFCNAGFALQTDSLIPYQSSPTVLHVVAVLIIVGGLGPAVVVAVPRWLRGRRVSLHVRLVLVATLVLLAVPAAAILAFEWGGPLQGLGFWNRVHNAWFQSVTLRTAGFNSIDLAALRPITLAVMVALMFVGGSPGSTAGGVKTTTLAVLALAVLAALRSQAEIRVYGRRLATASVYRATALVTLSACFVGLAVGGLLLTQRMPAGTALFEVVSAFGTVGLSVGGTGMLDGVGKTIIMACMFAGRVGPLSLLLWIADPPREDRWKLPEEEVATG